MDAVMMLVASAILVYIAGMVTMLWLLPWYAERCVARAPVKAAETILKEHAKGTR